MAIRTFNEISSINSSFVIENLIQPPYVYPEVVDTRNDSIFLALHSKYFQRLEKVSLEFTDYNKDEFATTFSDVFATVIIADKTKSNSDSIQGTLKAEDNGRYIEVPFTIKN